MAMVGVDDHSLQADSQPKSVSLVLGLVAACNLVYIHRNEPTELSQWPCLDDSTINTGIIIITLCSEKKHPLTFSSISP